MSYTPSNCGKRGRNSALPILPEHQIPPYLIKDPHSQDWKGGVHDVIEGDKILVVHSLEESGGDKVSAQPSWPQIRHRKTVNVTRGGP